MMKFIYIVIVTFMMKFILQSTYLSNRLGDFVKFPTFLASLLFNKMDT